MKLTPKLVSGLLGMGGGFLLGGAIMLPSLMTHAFPPRPLPMLVIALCIIGFIAGFMYAFVSEEE